MGKQTAGRRVGKAAGRGDDSTAGGGTVKVTLRLSAETAQRLGVAAVMRRVSMSSIAEELIGPVMRRWRLPSNVAENPTAAPSPAKGEDAA